MPTSRVEAFSDGVFAVAITLLVLDLRVPITSKPLITALADEWPAFAGFLISFIVIGVVWVNHHGVFHRVANVDRPLLFLNLFLLMAVVLIPFATALMAQYVAHGGAQAEVAAAMFNGAQVLMALGFQGCTFWLDGHPQLLAGHAQPTTVAQRLRFGSGLLVYLLCIPLSFVSPIAALGLDGVVAAFYITDQLSSRRTAG